MKLAVHWVLMMCLSGSLLIAGWSMDLGGASCPATPAEAGTKPQQQEATPANQEKMQVGIYG